MAIRRRLGDMWRGYSDEDRATLEAKLEAHRDDAPGTLVPLTRGEFKCFLADDYAEPQGGATLGATLH